jgi:CRISPR-associated endonuclease/helicase Cas3
MLAVRRTEFWIRHLFSALVDADWLDTEAFFDPVKGGWRAGFESLGVLAARLKMAIKSKQLSISPERSHASITVRNAVLTACTSAADSEPGFYSLTAPTGSGKTLSSMAFALRHAEKNKLDRVIVVLPYTSIIEQNAAVYRQALGADGVIEHHSNFDPRESGTGADETAVRRNLLAAENWDAPVIVTTTVQLFESLFSNRPSQCRKLHNIARSVIILDEVQTLPAGFLLAILDALNELVAHYGCTVLLSTATPPALQRRSGFETGLTGVRPILDDPAALNRQWRRVEYHWPSPTGSIMTWAALASKIVDHPCCLAIVPLRADARELAQLVASLRPEDPGFHLSALMCAAHRASTLKQVRYTLSHGGSCRLIATPLVEAGVDIDFPVVWRALCGLDSIVQAAGRCNREGRSEIGKVFVFRAPSAPPPGTPRKALEVTSAMLAEGNSSLDLDDPAIFDSYFRRLYMTEEPDKHGIQALRQELRFASVAREFRLIEDGWTQPVIVPFGDSMERVDRVRRAGPSRDALRGLQRYVVQIPAREHERLLAEGVLEEVVPGMYALKPEYFSLYDSRYGLVIDGVPDPTGDAGTNRSERSSDAAA